MHNISWVGWVGLLFLAGCQAQPRQVVAVVECDVSGYSVFEVDTLVAHPLRASLVTCVNVDQVTAISTLGHVKCYVELTTQQDDFAIQQDLRNAIESARASLPVGCTLPKLALQPPGTTVPNVVPREMPLTQLKVDQDRLTAYGLTIDQVNQAVAGNLPIHTEPTHEQLQALQSLVIKLDDGQTVRLRDVAQIEVTSSPSHIIRDQ